MRRPADFVLLSDHPTMIGTSCQNNEIAATYVGDTCGGLIIHQNLPNHPESAAANANPTLAIDYIAVAEPPDSSGNFLFKMKVTNLTTVPPNSRWRMVWDSFSSPGQQYYVGMRSDASSAVTFEYGTVATAVVASRGRCSHRDVCRHAIARKQLQC